jgi:hypothetical protein
MKGTQQQHVSALMEPSSDCKLKVLNIQMATPLKLGDLVYIS